MANEVKPVSPPAKGSTPPVSRLEKTSREPRSGELDSAPAKPVPARPTKAADKPPTVLVIDDSDIARAEMKRLLTEAGMQVMTLASPIGATRAILDGNVDVVVIDVLMPGMRGDRLAALFRSNPRFKTLGVVLVSGEDPSELRRLLEETRASAVVQKRDLKGLVTAVQRLLRSRSPAGDSGG